MLGILKRYKKPHRVIALCLCSVVPLIMLVLGIRALFVGTVINIPFLMLFFVLPIGMIVSSFLLFGGNFSSTFKRIVAAVLVVWYVVASAGAAFMGMLARVDFFSHATLESYTGDEALSRYRMLAAEDAELPSADELGAYTHVAYYDYQDHALIFVWQARTLVCQYGEAEYAAQKASIDARFTFHTEPILFASGDDTCAPTDTLDGYTFRVVKTASEEYYDQFPKRAIMIGTNDKTHSIVYLYYIDEDLDTVDSIGDLIVDYCGWRHIEK